MLKTLKITSFISVVAAAGAVVVLIVFALRGNPEARAFLDRPGVVERFKDKGDTQGTKEDVSSPLVAQAKAFALRIDPPPPPKPPAPKNPTPPKEVVRTKPTPNQLPTPKVQISNKYDVLATVKYESVPEKSLVLLKTTGNKQEWFRQGETAGNLTITEIKDGSVIFSQGGKQLPEAFVPAKPQGKSLLKNEAQISSAASGAGTGRVELDLPSTGNLPSTGSESAAPTHVTSPAQNARNAAEARIRSLRSASRSREDVTSRIQRIRSIPRQPSPTERKESLENTLSGIENIMNRQDEGLDEKQQQREKELWMTLMQKIQAEKKNVEKKIESKDTEAESTSEDAEPSGAGDPNDS